MDEKLILDLRNTFIYFTNKRIEEWMSDKKMTKSDSIKFTKALLSLGYFDGVMEGVNHDPNLLMIDLKLFKRNVLVTLNKLQEVRIVLGKENWL